MFRTLLLVALLPLTSLAQSRDAVIDQTIATLSHVTDVTSVAIAPDGASVAYVTHTFGGIDLLHVGDARVTMPHDASDPAWSPDSSRIAFVSDGLQVANGNGSNVRALTTINASFSKPKWSPDGKRIAVLAIESASRKGGAL